MLAFLDKVIGKTVWFIIWSTLFVIGFVLLINIFNWFTSLDTTLAYILAGISFIFAVSVLNAFNERRAIESALKNTKDQNAYVQILNHAHKNNLMLGYEYAEYLRKMPKGEKN